MESRKNQRNFSYKFLYIIPAIMFLAIFPIMSALECVGQNCDSSMSIAIVDTTPPFCTFSATPTNISANSTGLYEILINCTDASEINISRFIITTTVEGFNSPGIPNYWSIRPPINNKSDTDGIFSIPQILLADGRNDGKWYESVGLFDDNFTYAVQGEDSVFVNITSGTGWSQLNFTRTVDVSAFRKSAFLSVGMMEKEEKKDYSINNNDNLLVKFWNIQNMRGQQNYTVCIFRNINYTGNPDRDLKSHFCNESYDPTGSTKTQDSTNCVFINSLDKTDLDDIYYTSRNSSYSTQCFGIINGMLGGIEVTDTFYISYETRLDVAGNYTFRYANGSSGTNVSFKDSEVAWTTTNDGTTWTQAEFTPDVWFSSINEGDQFQAGVYVEDILGNNLTNFTFYTDDIGDVNHPISSPNILWFYSDYTGKDEDKNETHNGLMQIKIGIAIDPDVNGAVNHSLYLVNVDGLLNYTINDSIYSADDYDMNITFDTSLVPDGVYRMNVTAVADDNPLDIESHITTENFTIDNTNPTINLKEPLNNEYLSNNSFIVTFNVTDTNAINNCSLYIDNTLTQTNTSIIKGVNTTFNLSLQAGNTYEYNITCYDSANNLNTSETRTFTIYNFTYREVSYTLRPMYVASGFRIRGQDANVSVDFNERNQTFTYEILKSRLLNIDIRSTASDSANIDNETATITENSSSILISITRNISSQQTSIYDIGFHYEVPIVSSPPASVTGGTTTTTEEEVIITEEEIIALNETNTSEPITKSVEFGAYSLTIDTDSVWDAGESKRVCLKMTDITGYIADIDFIQLYTKDFDNVILESKEPIKTVDGYCSEFTIDKEGNFITGASILHNTQTKTIELPFKVTLKNYRFYARWIISFKNWALNIWDKMLNIRELDLINSRLNNTIPNNTT